jgi:hypothetical protein
VLVSRVDVPCCGQVDAGPQRACRGGTRQQAAKDTIGQDTERGLRAVVDALVGVSPWPSLTPAPTEGPPATAQPLNSTRLAFSSAYWSASPPQARVRLPCQSQRLGHQDHRGVPVAPAVSRGGLHQPLHLGLRQVLASAQVGVGGPFGPDCSVYGSWRDQLEVPFGHALRAPAWMTVRIMVVLDSRQRVRSGINEVKMAHPPLSKKGLKALRAALLHFCAANDDVAL